MEYGVKPPYSIKRHLTTLVFVVSPEPAFHDRTDNAYCSEAACQQFERRQQL